MSNHQGSIIWHTSSNMTLIVSTVEYWAAIWLSMCSDLSRISPILSVLMMEWCLVRSRCSSWTWSFRFWISVWKDYKHTHTHIYRYDTRSCWMSLKQRQFDGFADARWSASERENLAAYQTGQGGILRGNHAAELSLHCLRIRGGVSSTEFDINWG